ncbi:hypothetical protein LGR54_01750 [Ancylobacter sp. Lp-2]|uniref:hypothetical protein n=1 Tax=Ancylobacter sp. Lp-2 TaxID=2881339 RepID=UPI001E568385|nr:hypothetical protein [Ancylobacter sp. Lp-2]MCB4767316.1 hypothetical protein [Ancylobacter sp. Lp-2]
MSKREREKEKEMISKIRYNNFPYISEEVFDRILSDIGNEEESYFSNPIWLPSILDDISESDRKNIRYKFIDVCQNDIDSLKFYIKISLDFYDKLLNETPSLELRNIYNSVIKSETFARLQKMEARDVFRFFNEPKAEADYTYWADLACWSVDEATALSFGKEPRVVNRETLAEPMPGSRFKKEYEARFERFTRAIQAGDLTEPLRPRDLMRRIAKFGISYPQNLIDLIPSDKNVQIENNNNYQELQNEVQRLRTENAALMALNFEPDESKPSTKSLYKLILAMAVGGYSFKIPGNSGAVSDIIDDMTRHIDGPYAGILKLSDEAIRSTLRRAAAALGVHEVGRR